MDIGASNNFLQCDETKKLDILCNEKQGWLKAINSEPRPIFGVARGVKVCRGDRIGRVDFSIVLMDDYLVVLGMEFMDQVKAVPISFTNTMCILKGNASMVPLSREVSQQAKQLSTLQSSKGIRKGQPTFLATINEEIEDSSSIELPKKVSHVFEEFKDVMPPTSPKKLRRRKK